MIVTASARSLEPGPLSGAGSTCVRPALMRGLIFLARHGVACGLLLATTAWSTPPADSRHAAVSDSNGDSKLRHTDGRSQLKHNVITAAAGGTGYVQAIAPERRQERAQLLRTGEAALARLELDAAINAFDRAGLIEHAADTEISLVRAYMQAGQYRRALASGAHTAGAHLDAVASSALYAWLLLAGGQGVIGQRLLDEAQARLPNNPIVDSAQRQLRSGSPLATGLLLRVPTRLAPYSSGPRLPRRAQVAGSALLLADGRQALAPLALVTTGSRATMWVRNGIGQRVSATVLTRLPSIGVALLQLDKPLPVADAPAAAANQVFPGSAGFAVEYTANPGSEAAWPVLHTGFLGGMTNNPARPDERALGITMPPGPRGGPVFDAAGRLIGMALAPPGLLQKAAAAPILVSAAILQRALGQAAPSARLGAAPPASVSAPVATLARVPVDVIYENALRTTLQLITLR